MNRIGAVVLAAGQSSRFRASGGAEETKLVATLSGKPIIRRVVEAALASGARPVVVVVGHARGAVEAAIAELPAAVAFNPEYGGGIGFSLRAGLAAMPADVGGAVVLLGDMPKVEAQLIDALIDAFHAHPDARAAAPLKEGRRGNPVLLGRQLFESVTRLSGDEGARRLIDALDPRSVVEIDAAGFNVAFDVDTLDDLAPAGRPREIPRSKRGD